MPRAHNAARASKATEHARLEDVRGTLVELRRLLQRKELVALWAEDGVDTADLDYGEIRLLDAIRVAQAKGDRGTTVGDLAVLLGIDPSRASRQVARAVDKGHLMRTAAQDDGRKVVLTVTTVGARLQAKGSDLTRTRIGRAMQAWTVADRDHFSLLFRRFVAGLLAPPSAETRPRPQRQARAARPGLRRR